jgi:hypothetical protein
MAGHPWTRTILAGIIISSLALAAPPTAQAHPGTHPSYGRRLRSEMAHVPLPRPLPAIVHGHCPGISENDMTEGCYDDTANTLYVDRGVDRFGINHELGHAYDEDYMDATERQRFATLVGAPRDAWNATTVTPDGYLVQSDDAVSELFADAYAACRLRMLPMIGHDWVLVYGYMPRAPRHVKICGLIARAALTPGTPVDVQGWR